VGEQQQLTPGQDWLAIIKRPTQAAFASAFADGVILDTAVTDEPTGRIIKFWPSRPN